jgi:hypothetical protein
MQISKKVRFMKNIRITLLLGLAACLAIALLTECSKKETRVELPQYPNWQTYSYKHFVFHYPPDCFWAKRMEQFSNSYERYLTEICSILAIEIPSDTIHFYIHNSPEAGKLLTGRDLPFFTGNQIHWDRFSPFGLELARYLISKMDIRMTDFRVLYDGLATLLDYSGYDYHHNTYSLVVTKQFIPLDSLANNESFARADSVYRGWEAASLVGFMTYNFGINRFKMLWQSTSGFEESIKQLYGVDLKRFEEGWLQFAKTYYKGLVEDEHNFDSTAKK